MTDKIGRYGSEACWALTVGIAFALAAIGIGLAWLTSDPATTRFLAAIVWGGYFVLAGGASLAAVDAWRRR